MRVRGIQNWLGPILLLIAIVTAGSLMEWLCRGGGLAWLIRAYLVFSLFVLGAYLQFVFRPMQRFRRERDECRELCHRQHEALVRVLREFRYGDLVAAQEPMGELPEEVSNAASAAVSSLGGLIQQIQNVSVEVAGAAGTVHDTATQLASGSSEQAASVVEITATMEELARTAGQIAGNAAKQAELASQSDASGRSGAQAVEAAVAGMESLLEHMETISGRAGVLDARAREIYRILALITEISQETHILSLNAAIEASAAGEHGERFAVVAKEVRRLAERSRESVESVRSLLDEFTGAIRAVVVASEEGTKASHEVLGQSRSTAEAIEKVSSALRMTAESAREISLATEEQRHASNDVLLTVREQNEVIQAMADGLAEFTGAAEELNQLALSIQLLSQSFRLESEHSLKNIALEIAAHLSAVAENGEAVEGVLREQLNRMPFLELVYFVDTRGVMRSFASHFEISDRDGEAPIRLGEKFADRPWFRAVEQGERTAVTPVYESLMSGDPCFTVAARVRGLQGESLGTLGIDVNIRNWTRI